LNENGEFIKNATIATPLFITQSRNNIYVNSGKFVAVFLAKANEEAIFFVCQVGQLLSN
jgi:hypothetical protein